jgi:hypothetical protein
VSAPIRIRGKSWSGSGFVVSVDGGTVLVVTNHCWVSVERDKLLQPLLVVLVQASTSLMKTEAVM